MIVVVEPDRFVVVSQPDHAFVAGELLSLWRADGLPENPRRDDLLFATRNHDNGWREADAAPATDPRSGLPFDFTALPQERRFDIWRRGVERFASERPYVAALIAEHALAVHVERRDLDGWREFLRALEERRDELRAEAGVAAAALAADYRFLHLADLLSLSACARWSTPFERWGWSGRWVEEPAAEGRDVAGQVEITPFPLAGTTTFQVPARSIPRRPYRGDADLGGELAAARWSRIAFRLVPSRREAF